MPGDACPTAAILSPMPMARSALTACGLVLTAAPISPKAGAVSNTSALIPKVFSACAAAIPASPPPTIAILQLDGIHSSSALSLRVFHRDHQSTAIFVASTIRDQ